MSSVQDRVIELCEKAEPKENLQKWTRGYIPRHYKRLSIDMSDAIRLAKIGAVESVTYFQTNPFFTQSLIFGAIASGEFSTITIVTTSQYGKSYTMGRLATYMAFKGQKVNLAGGSEGITNIIMGNVLSCLPESHPEVQQSLLESRDKIEKLQTSVSKKKLSFKTGGSIEMVTLGASTNDPLKNNKAIGVGGNYIIDEADLVGRDAYAELGRREFSSVDGKKDVLIEISNPHRGGIFYEHLTMENPPKDHLIIWMDVRTALEESRIESIEQVQNSIFFQEKSTCQRYLLCELKNSADDSMFQELKVDDSPIGQATYFLGVDSAYTGKDSIDVCLCCTSNGMTRVVDIVTINKGKWQVGKTSERIIKDILKIQKRYHARFICVDIGWGAWLVEGLAKNAKHFHVLGINFGSATTKKRKEKNHFSALYGSNKRAEMYLDLQQLVDHKKITFTTEVAKKIAPQLAEMKTVDKSGGKMAMIPKDQIKAVIGHSPDEADAVVLSVHAMLLYNMDGGIYVYTNN